VSTEQSAQYHWQHKQPKNTGFCEKSGIVEFSDVNGEITIDSVLQECYSGSESMNHCMSGDFPTLPPGNSTVSWMGNVTNLTVQPNWRYL